MISRSVYVYPGIAMIASALYISRRMKLVRLPSHQETLLWTFREWQAGYPVPVGFDEWDHDDMGTNEAWGCRLNEMLRAWNFLRLFFASRGYLCYKSHKHPASLFPTPAVTGFKDLEISGDLPYPYARGAFKTELDAEFIFSSCRAWPAKDSTGRDVVIKVVSDRTPTNELKINQWLDSDIARIPVLEYISYGDFTFIIMPRWGRCRHKFYTIAEIVHMIQSLLEGLDFLHENRIAHCDLMMQNIALDILAGQDDTGRHFRDPKMAHYAIFDFGASLIFPPDISLDDAVDNRAASALDVNPFKGDVRKLGGCFRGWVKRSGAVVPGLDSLFENMVLKDTNERLTARQALEDFRKIRASLSSDKLEQLLDN